MQAIVAQREKRHRNDFESEWLDMACGRYFFPSNLRAWNKHPRNAFFGLKKSLMCTTYFPVWMVGENFEVLLVCVVYSIIFNAV